VGRRDPADALEERLHHLGAGELEGLAVDPLLALQVVGLGGDPLAEGAVLVGPVTSLAVKAATILGSKSWKARRKPSRLASTVRQDRPAWNTSRLRRSNQPASPTGASPHSLSW
jgi:hypothetical protein